MKIYGLILLALLMAGAGLYQLGRSDALARYNYSAVLSSVKILRDKGAIHAQVSHSAAAALCRDYGLPDGEISKCVRGVREITAKP
ncbi:hypothetical protein [Pseudochrobactrum sp. HB0163]|uniref:hypothetical protein n=1 Tax=Pseudochrobactrum sp. HB0163 TaxID=3450708 RepID=UPI003F6E34D6